MSAPLIVLFLLFFGQLIFSLFLLAKIIRFEKKLSNLQLISEHFPEFLEKSAQVSSDIYVQLHQKLIALKKVVQEGQDLLTKLQIAERDCSQKKNDPEKIEKILLLINQGFKAEEIATNLNIPLAEVEFILNLKRFMQKNSAAEL